MKQSFNMRIIPITFHVPMGKVTMATPNGRRAGEYLSDGIVPSHGCDTKGPTVTHPARPSLFHPVPSVSTVPAPLRSPDPITYHAMNKAAVAASNPTSHPQKVSRHLERSGMATIKLNPAVAAMSGKLGDIVNRQGQLVGVPMP